jgi:hypothetical protein
MWQNADYLMLHTGVQMFIIFDFKWLRSREELNMKLGHQPFNNAGV